MKRKNHAVNLTRGALVAALYVVLTYVSALFGLASGAIQLRISEALCVLPLFMPEAVLGLFVGCLISNLLTTAVIWDVIFGSLATLIGAVGAHLLGRCGKKFAVLAPLPTVMANALIVPFVLRLAYGAPEALWFLVVTVGIGEVLSAWVLGLVLYSALKRIFK